MKAKALGLRQHSRTEAEINLEAKNSKAAVMSSDEIHSPHWPGDHNDELIKIENDTVHISAKAMSITWGNDHRFWQWTKLSRDDSCFEVGAELIQVNWIEVKGTLDLEKYPLIPLKTYEVIYLINFKVDAFGWHSSPITFEVCTSDGNKSSRREILEQYKLKESHHWHEIYGGEFNLNAGYSSMGKIQFSMKEVKTEWWKGGIVLEGVRIRPKLALT